jgi:hypothetical protein
MTSYVGFYKYRNKQPDLVVPSAQNLPFSHIVVDETLNSCMYCVLSILF